MRWGATNLKPDAVLAIEPGWNRFSAAINGDLRRKEDLWADMSQTARDTWRKEGDRQDCIRVVEFTCAYDTNLHGAVRLKEKKQEYLNLVARWRVRIPDTELVAMGIGALGTCPSGTRSCLEKLVRLGKGVGEDVKLGKAPEKAMKKASVAACEHSCNIWDTWVMKDAGT